MGKYEKSFEKVHPHVREEALITEVEEYRLVITEQSKDRVEWLLQFAEKLAKEWEGIVKVSYDETQEIRDYVIRIIVKMIDFYNTYMIEEFADLAREASFVGIRSYPKDRDKVELIIIQSNAEMIPEDEISDWELDIFA